jgi:hypothetical protein
MVISFRAVILVVLLLFYSFSKTRFSVATKNFLHLNEHSFHDQMKNYTFQSSRFQ